MQTYSKVSTLTQDKVHGKTDRGSWSDPVSPPVITNEALNSDGSLMKNSDGSQAYKSA
jgi:hypothetical protein